MFKYFIIFIKKMKGYVHNGGDKERKTCSLKHFLLETGNVLHITLIS